MSDRKAFLIDIFRCIGCDTCSVACKMENDIPLGQSRLRILNPQQTTVFDKPNGQYPDLEMEWWPVMCQHCDDAPCVNDCPTYAIHQREDGLIEIDPEMCVGCQNCGELCPYGAINFNSDIGTSDKCDMCDHRVQEGLQPMCVEVCPTRALYFGDIKDPDGRLLPIIKNRPSDILNEDAGTQPTTQFVFRR
ncbi:MAG: 4Fe-4S dicluster domain-containing protein [Pseudomonadales bacterium]|nr:4Fe-4S dicluster domain-containing protein [Pseudomonadales bacterium]